MTDGAFPGGPYPNKAGEYCGNYYLHQSSEETERLKAYLARMRFGRPRPCQAGTMEEMEKDGYVGLYLKEDRELMSWEKECPTPPELLEPPTAIGDLK